MIIEFSDYILYPYPDYLDHDPLVDLVFVVKESESRRFVEIIEADYHTDFGFVSLDITKIPIMEQSRLVGLANDRYEEILEREKHRSPRERE